MNNITIQTQPPKELEPATAELVLKRRITKNGFAAMIVDLAIRGYLHIEREAGSNNYTLTKNRTFLNDSDLKDYEIDLLKVFFDSKDYFSSREIRKKQALAMNSSKGKEELFSHYKKIEDVRTKIFNNVNTDKKIRLLSVETEKKRNIALAKPIMFFATYFLLYFFFASLIPGPGHSQTEVAVRESFKTFFFSPGTASPFRSGVVVDIINLLFNIYLLFFIFIIFIFTVIRIYKNYQLSPGGEELAFRNKLLGFKRFLKEVAEGNGALSERDCLEKYIPYAMIFGISEMWMKKFEKEREEISWYSHYGLENGRNKFSPYEFSEVCFIMFSIESFYS